MANLKGETVYVAAFSYKNLESSIDDYVTTRVFSDLEKAKAWISKDYNAAKEEYSDDDTVTSILSAENYGESAEIRIGYQDSDEIYSALEWNIHKETIDND